MKFTTIMADPAWPYDSPRAIVGNGGRGADGGKAAAITQVDMTSHYPPMSMEDICALRVPDIAEKNAHLYLWVTNAFLVDGSGGRVATAWGFRPITVITWTKTKKGRPEDDPEPSMKTGYYYRGATEHCIFAVRGSLRTLATESTAFFHPRLRHSEKPPAFYDRVERCSPGGYAELFARSNRPGWEAWGNDSGLIKSPTLAVLG